MKALDLGLLVDLSGTALVRFTPRKSSNLTRFNLWTASKSNSSDWENKNQKYDVSSNVVVVFIYSSWSGASSSVHFWTRDLRWLNLTIFNCNFSL